MLRSTLGPLSTLIILALAAAPLGAQDTPPDGVHASAPESALLQFTRIGLDDRFLCEGASYGDLDGDGDHDLVVGPWWYEGPDFGARHALYEETVFDRLKYSDHFFSWTYDFNRDDEMDIFVVGFPGQEAYWLQNPGGGLGEWTRHEVFHEVDNESPEWTDLTGDGRPELVCMHGGKLGWLDWDVDAPESAWVFRAATAEEQGGRFQHGLGVGDLDGDGRADLLLQHGWWKQPASLDGDPEWEFRDAPFGSGYGGAQMLVADFDGDGDNDVVSSIAAHGWGLSYFESIPGDNFPVFVEQPILAAPQEGATPGENFSEPHALALGDFDGDGAIDFVTGKRWWSHGPDGKPDAGGPAVVAVFLARRADGVKWEMQRVDNHSGVGVQVTAGDIDGNGRADVLVANKAGASVFLQQDPAPLPTGPNLGFESGTLAGWTAEGEAFRGQPVRGDTIAARITDWNSEHEGDYWIGGYELMQDSPTGTLTSDPFTCTAPWASFLIGGGRAESTRVEILRDVDGQVLFSCSGPNYESMQRVAVDLSGVLGQDLRIRIVDENAGGWGHINFDDFRFHDEQPEIPTPVKNMPRVHPYPTLQTTGLAPLDAAAAMTVPDGFQVDLIAGEPDLHQPVALTTDTSGRLWVAEAHSYPAKRGPGKGLDKILVFEDKDLDGSYETRTVFYEGLDLVSGLAVGFGGVWIGAAPEMLFIPDADRDLVPDGPPVVMLDGFGYQDTHETLNSFIWGPDGWLYGCHGVFTHSKVGRPGTPDAERVGLNAGVWRMHPQTMDFEVFAYGTSNPWGLDFNEHGQAVITACVIPHLWHMVQGGRYQRQGGSHFDPYVYSEIGTIGDHLHYAGNVGDHAWWGRNRSVADPSTDLAGGGHTHCGAMIYLESQFPEEYRGSVLMNNILGNRINRDVLEPVSSSLNSGLVGRHAPDFLRANDQWYRGIALRAGPDGSVYFIDWYDKNACHRNDTEIWDRTNGRLFRVSYGEPVAMAVDLHEMSDLELVDVLRDGEEWWARKARQVLQERSGKSGAAAEIAVDATVALLETALGHGNSGIRLRALWALHAIGGIDDLAARKLLRSDDAWVRSWTVRSLLENGEIAEPLHGMLVAMALSETAPQFQLALSSALQRMPLEQRWSLATVVTGWEHHAEDQNIPNVLWYGIEPMVGADPGRALSLAAQSRIPQIARWIWRRLAAGNDAEREALVAALLDADAQQAMLEEMAAALKRRPGTDAPPSWQAVSTVLFGAQDSAVREAAAEVALAFGDEAMGPLFRARLMDRTLDTAKRRAALEGLVRMNDPQVGRLLLHAHDFPELRVAALRGLGTIEVDSAVEVIVAAIGHYDLDEREIALQTLCSRKSYALDFLDAVGDGRAARSLLDSVVMRRQLLALEDAEVTTALDRAWGRIAPPNAESATEIARLKAKYTPAVLALADLPNGRAIAARTCTACHVFHGSGGTLGPDITGSNRSDLDYLLSNLVSPSDEVGNDYRMTTVRMKDSRLLSGVVVREDDRSLTLRTGAGEETLLKVEMSVTDDGSPAITRLAMSLMPPGQLQALTDADARDLLAYLQNPNQVPMRATEATVGSFWNGRDLSNWQGDPAVWKVEDGEIVGRTTAGLEHNNFLASELLLRDFRLVVDVQLVGGAGNSGVQFRSTPLDDGEMRGLQADAGEGWWGRLYEEQGRGLLVPELAPTIHADGWNRYEIVAVGDRTLTALNGQKLFDRSDAEAAPEGVIGLQLHSGGPTEVRFRIVRLELDPEPVLNTLD